MLASGRMPASRSTSAGKRTNGLVDRLRRVHRPRQSRAGGSLRRHDRRLPFAARSLLLLDRLLEQLQRLPLADAAPRRQYRELAGARRRVALLPVVDRPGADADEPAEVGRRKTQARALRLEALGDEADLCGASLVAAGAVVVPRRLKIASCRSSAVTCRRNAAMCRRYWVEAFFVACTCTRTSRRASRVISCLSMAPMFGMAILWFEGRRVGNRDHRNRSPVMFNGLEHTASAGTEHPPD